MAETPAFVPSTPEADEVAFFGKLVEPGDQINGIQAVMFQTFVLRYLLSHRYDDASRICMSLLKGGTNDIVKQGAVSCLARTSLVQGKFDEAERLIGGMLSTRNSDSNRDPNEGVGNLLSLANLYRARGFLLLADRVLQKAQVVFESKVLPKLDRTLVSPHMRDKQESSDAKKLDELQNKYRALSEEYARLFQLEEEERDPETIAAIDRILADQEKLAEAMQTISQRYNDRSRVGSSLQIHLRILRERYELEVAQDKDAESMQSLARLVSLTEQYTNRLPAVDEAFAIYNSLRRQGNLTQAAIYLEIAHRRAKEDIGYLHDAPEPLPTVFNNSAAESLFGVPAKSGLLSSSIARMGRVYLAETNYSEARRFLEAATEGTRFAFGEDGAQIALILTDLARVDRQQQNVNAAITKLREAMRIVASQHDEASLLPAGRAVELSGAQQEVSLELIEALHEDVSSKTVETNVRNELLLSAFQLVRHSAADAAIRAAAIRQGLRDPHKQKLIEKYQTGGEALARLRAQYALLSFSPASSNQAAIGDQETLQSQIEAQKLIINEVGAKLAEQSTSQTIAFQKNASFQNIVRELRQGEALIQFIFGVDKGFLLLTTAEGRQVVRKIERTRVDLRTQVEALLRGLTLEGIESSGKPRSFPLEAAFDVYSSTLGLIETELAGVNRLFVVADGPLDGLPLSVLLRSQAPQGIKINQFHTLDWQIRHQELVYLPTAAALPALRSLPKTTASRDLIGFSPLIPAAGSIKPLTRGGVVDELYALPVKKKDLKLKVVGEEVTALRDIVGASHSTLYLGPDATKSKLKGTRLSEYKVIVFGTHGFLASELIEIGEPGLLMQPEPGSRKQSFLTTAEVAALHLDANLVLLNACNTAGAAGLPGAEALSGLARAFFFAGARSIVVSLWPVENRTAINVAIEMFKIVKTRPDTGASGALKYATLNALTTAQGTLKHPAFWAPLIIVGDGAIKPL